MERVLEHVDVEEMYLDVDSENLPEKGEIVETAHFFVGQAYNAHIHVVEKESGDMVMHINCTIMYSKERLQALVMDGEYARKHTVRIPLIKMGQLAQYVAPEAV